MSLLRRIFSSNWVITLVATTMGVLLAFYVDGLGQQHRIKKQKALALKNIIEELTNNRKQLEKRSDNIRILYLLDTLTQLNKGNDLNVITGEPEKIHAFIDPHPHIHIKDSTLISGNKFEYDFYLELNINMIQLPDVAWQAATLSDFSQEIDYECLAELINVYSAQQFFLDEQAKMTNHIIEEDLPKLRRTMTIAQDIRQQLIAQYEKSLEIIKGCQ
ncbi:hypothetical protein [Persicobacter sp. CCB-QB2]|uniref:hypothetical protein n=1 Tax=Persicobacter sp. CCB-QB2 TaxID=1561025 RepID=UPI0012F9C1DB|nr:hypothetical protein [Persicobacter sp. CCB-QB2]